MGIRTPDPNYKSKCCSAEVVAEGMPDFMGSNEVVTVTYVCLKCDQSCGIKPAKKPKPARKKKDKKNRAN